MPATAENLRDLHQLHQRARALQDRLSSGPKTLAARQAALNARQAELEAARKALQEAKIGMKKHEHSLQAIETKIDDSKIKLNQAKKNEEYKAHQNQIAHDSATKSKLEEQVLQAMEVIETKTSELAKLEADAKKFSEELAAFRKQVEEQSIAHKAQLRELKTAITGAEIAIPDDFREQYRRIVSRYGTNALAVCEDGACHGCFTAVTTQMLNNLINGAGLIFCLSCGRLLYLPEPEVANTRRK